MIPKNGLATLVRRSGPVFSWSSVNWLMLLSGMPMFVIFDPRYETSTTVFVVNSRWTDTCHSRPVLQQKRRGDVVERSQRDVLQKRKVRRRERRGDARHFDPDL